MKRTFTLTEIAEALHGPGSAAIAEGTVADPAGQSIGQRAMPAWMEVLNNILKKLGEEGRLEIMPTAVVVFPPSHSSRALALARWECVESFKYRAGAGDRRAVR